MATDRTTAAQLLWGRLAPGAADGPTDGELLAAFAATHGEADFAQLLARHGRMVLGVCRRLLGNAADADDAFQAVFLVLSRRAAALRGVRSVAGWLHGTAVRVALKARTREARRRARERKAALMRPTDTPAADDWDDIAAVLDGELDRLGARYRDPVVLCCVEGRSREEAARLLGWPEGTVNGRLARAKALLRDRLARRGVGCSVAGLTTLLSARAAVAVPAELARVTLAAVGGTVTPAVATLAVEPRLGWGWPLAAVVGLAVVGGVLALDRQPPPPDAPRAPAVVAEPVRLAHGSAVLAVAASAGSLATVGPGAEVRVWKADGTAVAKCAFPGGGSAVVFAPGGKLLAAAGYDGDVRVWDAATGALRHTLAGHGGAARAAAFSPDGTLVATGGEDGRVRLWDAKTGRAVRTLDGHSRSVWGLSFAPDGRELASAGGDQSVRVWNVTTGAARVFGGLRGGAYAVEYHATGRTLAVAADNTVLLLDAGSGREVARVATARTAVSWFALAPDGRTLAYRDGKAVRLWDVAAAADRFSLDLPAEPAAVAFTADSRSLVVASGDGAAVWELRRHARPLSPADSNDHWARLDARP
ncbi:sigma-70 family RNA polymerase sigma factor [Urbifossiella limnaea]|uniref:ECF RNA polymerase sigma factor SigE n=1 Tax=Urbifossiella limnaea TaxID=2528023 RepID=A0A517XNJ5_9BACT|nr:sigma-70 family RNA polymerase sigma factor [Urbifossiella limnaea]QDU19084.1 ECF RNA polymerase sigma factor SigE [Urbifossiella limnaea]